MGKPLVARLGPCPSPDSRSSTALSVLAQKNVSVQLRVGLHHALKGMSLRGLSVGVEAVHAALDNSCPITEVLAAAVASLRSIVRGQGEKCPCGDAHTGVAPDVLSVLDVMHQALPPGMPNMQNTAEIGRETRSHSGATKCIFFHMSRRNCKAQCVPPPRKEVMAQFGRLWRGAGDPRGCPHQLGRACTSKRSPGSRGIGPTHPPWPCCLMKTTATERRRLA